MQSIADYQARVQNELARNGARRELTSAEEELVREQWQAGSRTDVCAALIRTDRHLAGAGRAEG
ncbi:MAG TPA: hypothetical protein VK741_21675 [Acetobacteraceae bacterium]|nr:hypothetical protein [Acetobacteraceae bacterium]